MSRKMYDKYFDTVSDWLLESYLVRALLWLIILVSSVDRDRCVLSLV